MDEIQLSSVIKNYVTSSAIVLGGFWAFWKWSFSEWLRKRKEMAAVDGELIIESQTQVGEKIVLSLNAMWCNKSSHPVSIDQKSTQVDVFLISKELKEGVVDPGVDLGNPVIVFKPFEHLRGYYLEPNTDSLIKTHFALNRGEVYLFRWRLYNDSNENDKLVSFWIKELIYKTES